MNTRGWMIGVAALVLLGFGAAHARAEDDPLTAALRPVVEGHLAAYDREDVDATMSFVDSKSRTSNRPRLRCPASSSSSTSRRRWSTSS